MMRFHWKTFAACWVAVTSGVAGAAALFWVGTTFGLPAYGIIILVLFFILSVVISVERIK